MRTKKSIILDCVVISFIVLFAVGAIVFSIRRSRQEVKEDKEKANNICNAVCNNEQVVACYFVERQLKAVCITPETKIARVIEIKQ